MSIKNFIIKSISPKSVFDNASALVSTNSFAHGDLMVYDAGTIRKVTSGDTGSSFLGMSVQTVVSGVIASAYSTDNTTADNAISGPQYGVTASVVAKTADAFTAGCLVYLNVAGGARHVTSASAGLSAIGIYQGATIASATALQEIEVLLGQNLGGALSF